MRCHQGAGPLGAALQEGSMGHQQGAGQGRAAQHLLFGQRDFGRFALFEPRAPWLRHEGGVDLPVPEQYQQVRWIGLQDLDGAPTRRVLEAGTAQEAAQEHILGIPVARHRHPPSGQVFRRADRYSRTGQQHWPAGRRAG